MTDLNGDGMTGHVYYNKGRIKVRRSFLDVASYILSLIALTGLILIVGLVISASLNIKPAQRALEYVIAGRE